MKKKYVYFLSKENEPVLFASNFQVLYETLKQHQEGLHLIKMQAYSTVIAKIKTDLTIEFPKHDGTKYFIKKKRIIGKMTSVNQLGSSIF